MTLNQKVPSRPASPPTCCPRSSLCTVCPLSPPHPTWARRAPFPCRTSRAMPGRPATPWPRPSANPRCCRPAWVPLPQLPSRSAHLCTPTPNSPCTRAPCSTSQSACSSRSQSSHTKWGSRRHCIPLLLANRLVWLLLKSSKHEIWLNTYVHLLKLLINHINHNTYTFVQNVDL